jgi:hypothetical protein
MEKVWLDRMGDHWGKDRLGQLSRGVSVGLGPGWQDFLDKVF